MFFVIYCHSVLLPYHSVAGNLMMTIAWGAVPCFVMTSGAVLHQSKHFTWQKHGKRLGTMYMTLVCWRLLYLAVYRIAGKITGISFWAGVKSVSYTHLVGNQCFYPETYSHSRNQRSDQNTNQTILCLLYTSRCV